MQVSLKRVIGCALSGGISFWLHKSLRISRSKKDKRGGLQIEMVAIRSISPSPNVSVSGTSCKLRREPVQTVPGRRAGLRAARVLSRGRLSGLRREGPTLPRLPGRCRSPDPHLQALTSLRRRATRGYCFLVVKSLGRFVDSRRSVRFLVSGFLCSRSASGEYAQFKPFYLHTHILFNKQIRECGSLDQHSIFAGTSQFCPLLCR